MVWYRQSLEDSERKDGSMNELICENVYRTAPATPGLIITVGYWDSW